jgi:preprotein translocase subunit YajC
MLTHVLPTSFTASSLLAEAGAGSSLGSFLPIILMFAVVYLIVLRPMSKQEKERRKRVEALKKGDEVVIGGGILGRISNADDAKVAVVEIADKVKIRVLKKDIVDTKAAALKDDAKAGDKKPEKPEKADDKKADDKKADDKPADDKAAKASGPA